MILHQWPKARVDPVNDFIPREFLKETEGPFRRLQIGRIRPERTTLHGELDNGVQAQVADGARMKMSWHGGRLEKRAKLTVGSTFAGPAL